MDIAARLQRLEDMVREAKSMPLSSSALLNREEVLEILKEMQETLPEEIKQARWVVKDREDLLAKARHDAEAIVEAAREEQLRLARHEAVVERAEKEAERVLTEADTEAARIKDEAEDYVDAKLAQFEIVLRRLQEEAHTSSRALARTLDQVELGREKLRGAPTTVAEDRLGESPPETQLFDEDQGQE